MLRKPFAAVSFILFASAAFACDGQTGKVIFEDKFTDDSGGWNFGDAYALVLKPPGATVTVKANDVAWGMSNLNQTFTATQGDFCVEGTLPADAAKTNASIGVLFWGQDYGNNWDADARADGQVSLAKYVNQQWSMIFETKTNDVVRTGPTDVNSVRVVVKNGTITIIVNGQTVKTIRAQIPSDDLKFGFRVGNWVSSTTPVSFGIVSYKVTAGE
jgi:hypothetical protein